MTNEFRTGFGYPESHLWGCLIPCSPAALPRIDFWRFSPTYTIGRADENDIILAGLRVSNEHAVITWTHSPLAHEPGEVQIKDLSSNGTWVGGIQLLPLKIKLKNVRSLTV